MKRRASPGRTATGFAPSPNYARNLDDRLRDQGLTEAPQDGAILLIACGALAREVIALREANGWGGRMVLDCLPANLHNAPEQIAPAVRAKIDDGRRRGFASIFVLYADCGTGGALDRVCEAEGVERLPGPHCYAFFDGVEAFEARDEMRAFYLTDFLARQFEPLIWRGFGLDRRPEMRDILFAGYEKVVHLAQTDDPLLTAQAKDAADRLGLAFERRFTGYGELGTALAGIAAR